MDSLKGLWRIAVAVKVALPTPLRLEVESHIHFANQLPLIRV
jgi:hypothetical protein